VEPAIVRGRLRVGANSRHGIGLAGGGALLRVLDQRLRQETHIPTHLAESPLTCVAIGAGRSLEEFAAMRTSARASPHCHNANRR
jgi:rod shape-determining protein MreB